MICLQHDWGVSGSSVPEKKLLKRSLIVGILMASFRGTFTCIFAKAPSKSKSRVILSALGFLGGGTSEFFY
jgi:hypothetical protein